MQLMEGVVSTQKQHTASLQALEAKADTATRPHYQGTLQSLKELEELNDRLKGRNNKQAFQGMELHEVVCGTCNLYLRILSSQFTFVLLSLKTLSVIHSICRNEY